MSGEQLQYLAINIIIIIVVAIKATSVSVGAAIKERKSPGSARRSHFHPRCYCPTSSFSSPSILSSLSSPMSYSLSPVSSLSSKLSARTSNFHPSCHCSPHHHHPRRQHHRHCIHSINIGIFKFKARRSCP